MENNMKKVAPILMPIVFSLSGCTFVTSSQNYKICQSSHERTVQDESIRVYVTISGTRSSKTIVPLIYDADIQKEPYRCHFTIWGNYTEIKSASAIFILNGKKLPPLPLSITKMNNEKKDKKISGRSLFPAGGFEVPFIWDDIETLEMEVHFIAIDRDGNQVECEEKKTFKKYLHKRKRNRTWDTMMSV
jgi:hypothetical protein